MSSWLSCDIIFYIFSWHSTWQLAVTLAEAMNRKNSLVRERKESISNRCVATSCHLDHLVIFIIISYRLPCLVTLIILSCCNSNSPIGSNMCNACWWIGSAETAWSSQREGRVWTGGATRTRRAKRTTTTRRLLPRGLPLKFILLLRSCPQSLSQ